MKPQELLSFFNKHLKVRMNDPNKIISREDTIISLVGNKSDLRKILNSVGIFDYKPDITYGDVLYKIGIRI